jgi:murein L,D-transpeptidase YcbB/YkuD
VRTGHVSKPVRGFFTVSGVATALLAAAAPLALAPTAAAATVAATSAAGQGVGDFYAARGGAPLWFQNGQPSEAARLLMESIGSAQIDGLDPRNYRLSDIGRAMQAAWGGKPRAVSKADALLSQALVSYVRDMRHASGTGMIYVDQELQPGPPSPRAILDAAARAPSLSDYVARMGWMHPTYGELRRALAHHDYLSD